MTSLRSALVFLLLAGVACLAHAQSPDQAAIGLWAYESSFGSTVQGPLDITRKRNQWRAEIDARKAASPVKGSEISFELPDHTGRFRGTLRKDGAAIDGFWIRPGASDDPRFPGGASQPYATPVVLRSMGRNHWRGDVRVLPDPLRLFLKIFREPDGRLLAAFRDPDQNRNGGSSRFVAVIEGGRVAFQRPNDNDVFETAFTGTLAGDRIRVEFPDLGPIELHRIDPAQATAFFPRPPGEPAYAYLMPAVLDDGWPVSGARGVGLDEAAIASAVQGIIDGDPAARGPSLVHSILLARRGRLVLEEYFFGFDRDTPHDLRSAGKTFASILMGTARQQGVDIAPESTIYAVMVGRGPFANPDPRKASITLAHLLTHSAGLACNDNDDASPGNEDTMQSQSAQPDWWKYTLDLPMAHDPGKRYAYCSANINLVGGAVATAAKTWLPELFERTVARPLGFGEYHWNLTPTGDGYLGGGAYLRSRDLLKVGQAYLDGGTWHGQRLVDAAWVASSTASRMPITPETTGYSDEDFGNYYGRGEDAYAWHLGELKVGERKFRTYAAGGNGGQLLVVAPELELVIVFTGGNYRQGGIWSQWPQKIVGPVLEAQGTELP